MHLHARKARGRKTHAVGSPWRRSVPELQVLARVVRFHNPHLALLDVNRNEALGAEGPRRLWRGQRCATPLDAREGGAIPKAMHQVAHPTAFAELLCFVTDVQKRLEAATSSSLTLKHH